MGGGRDQHLFHLSPSISILCSFQLLINELFIFHKNHRKSPNMFFVLKIGTWLETFADARDGNKGRGNRDTMFAPSITQYKICMIF